MNKFIVTILILIIAVPFAASLNGLADLEVKVDGKPSGDIRVMPGDTVRLEVVKNNVAYIDDVGVESNNKIIQQAFNNYLDRNRGYGDYYTISITDEIPKGNFDLNLIIDYYDRNLVHKRYEKSIRLSSPEGSAPGFLSGMLSEQAAAELVDNYMNVQLQRLNPELEYVDLNKEDLKALGIPVEDYVEGLRLLEEGKRVEAMELLPDIKKTASSTKTQKYDDKEQEIEKKYLRKVKGKEHPDVKVIKNIYEVTKQGNSIDKSKVTFSVSAVEKSIGIDLLVVVPKEIARSVKDLDFSEEPEVIEEDPVIKWAFKNVPQGQTKDYAYTVSKDVQNFDTLAVAAAKKPSWVARLVKAIVGALT